MKVILASGSPYRKMQLESLGLTFSVEIPQVDEQALKTGDPKVVATRLAELKGQTIAKARPHDIVIAGDQVAYIENEILSKPKAFDKALAQLSRLQGKTHYLATALWMNHPQHGPQTHLVVATMKMKELSQTALTAYLEKDQPFDCAGSYKIERAGIALFDEIDCADFTSIVGLPIMSLTKTLEAWNIPILSI